MCHAGSKLILWICAGFYNQPDVKIKCLDNSALSPTESSWRLSFLLHTIQKITQTKIFGVLVIRVILLMLNNKYLKKDSILVIPIIDLMPILTPKDQYYSCQEQQRAFLLSSLCIKECYCWCWCQKWGNFNTILKIKNFLNISHLLLSEKRDDFSLCILPSFLYTTNALTEESWTKGVLCFIFLI